MTKIVDVRCRLFEAPGGPYQVMYANPLRAWDGAPAAEGSFGFHEWMTVEVELATGEIGVGNAALNPRLAIQVVSRQLAPLVLGQSSADREALWQRMYRTIVPFGRRGVGIAALSAVDIALWDVEGKRLGVPVYDLLGGLKAARTQVYASQLYPTEDLEALAAEAKRYVDAGFGAMKQRFLYGPKDGRSGLSRNVELVRAVRETIGFDIDLAADAYMGWDREYALRMVRLLEPYDLRWLEEPLLPDDIAGYQAVRAASPIPIAAGEHESTLPAFYQLITSGAVDIVQPDVNRVGGLTAARKVSALAEAAGIPLIPHAGQVHNYHLVASQPACPMAEYFPVNPEPLVGNEMPHLLFEGEPKAVDGYIELSRAPGLGISIAPRSPVREVELGDRSEDLG
ncbi:enolase C-terminal domain-like protein [Kribbella solani]|uniref:enolase C-terminal domain-like protein n=1 Tax=Kribbella solani TaxID=236067 RepID=UPI0029AFFB3C|nr:enolase C-terminal domain-like protein [Kribbella solani]MDX2973424.1 enolase C-terminal domain-like protein [Kribbella solani]